MPRSAVPVVVLTLLAACLLACGVGPVEETVFSYGAMGPEGGTVEAGDVTIVIPPGGLAEPTTIAILPEVNPLRVVTDADDPCGYALLGPQWCCGPIGLDLANPGQCTVRYDVTLVPAGSREDELVLMMWDEALQALVPAPQAYQDLAAHQFIVDPYTELGHLAIGVSACPELRIVLAGAVQQATVAPIHGPGGSADQTTPLVTGMYLADLEGVAPPMLLPTNDQFPQAFVPSPDETRVLFLRYFFEESEALPPAALVRQLYTVGIDGSAPVLVAGDDELLTGPDPSYGWLRSGGTVFLQEVLTGDPDTVRLSTVPGGGGQPTGLYPMGELGFLLDLRQSPDGGLMLLRYVNDLEAEVLDVFEVPTGAPVSQGLIPVGGGQSTPRFLPDGSAVYLVNGARDAVLTYPPDGSTSNTLYTPPVAEGLLKDFALAPNGDDYAYVAQVGQGDDVLYVGSLTGGARSSSVLGPGTTYTEFFIHPDGQSVLLDASGTNVRIFSIADATEGPALPAIDMRLLDVNESTGQLLMTVPPARPIIQVVDEDGNSIEQTAPVGVYLANPDGSGLTLVPTPSELEVEQARWLSTIRRAPGMPFENRIR